MPPTPPPERDPKPAAGLLTLYYLATPLFAVLDVAVGVPVRVAALGDPGWRYAYYAAAFLLGVLCRRRPAVAPLVGITESSVNLLLLILSVLLPIWDLPGDVAAGGAVDLGFGTAELWNVAIVGAALVLSFKRSVGELHAVSGFGSRDGTR